MSNPFGFLEQDMSQTPYLPDVFQQALKQYPVLQGLGLGYVNSPANGPNQLEYWPAGEPGSGSQRRPIGLPIDKPGVETYGDKARPIDILGDVVSHQLVNSDPKIGEYYRQFQGSMTPEQQGVLREQYGWAQKNEGEARSYEDWAKMTGTPAWFRGYAFQQWPNAAKAYTPEQRKMFDEMMGGLGR